MTDAAINGVLAFSPQGNLLGAWGEYGQSSARFDLPLAMTVDGQGRIYVVDAHNYRIQIFTPDGEFLATWGAHGAEPGNFLQPADIAFDADSFVYVTDLTLYRVTKFEIHLP